MSKFIKPWSRVIDTAYLRDNNGNEYTGEQLALAVLLHAKGKTKRGSSEEKFVARLMEDPNQK